MRILVECCGQIQAYSRPWSCGEDYEPSGSPSSRPSQASSVTEPSTVHPRKAMTVMIAVGPKLEYLRPAVADMLPRHSAQAQSRSREFKNGNRVDLASKLPASFAHAFVWQVKAFLEAATLHELSFISTGSGQILGTCAYTACFLSAHSLKMIFSTSFESFDNE